MDYRLCVCVDEEKKKSAFAVYNQQDLCVYRRVLDSIERDAETEYVRVCETALSYFKRNIRNRYYTEHFSELLDEDGGVLLCTVQDICNAFDAYRRGRSDIPEKYELLKEQFDIPSVRFVYAPSDELQQRTRALLE